MRIKITADSTCDLSVKQIQEHGIAIMPMIVNKDNQSHFDMVDITPAEIFAHVAAGGGLCTTSAIAPAVYTDFFQEQLQGYDALVHISLGSGFSATHRNALLAAEELSNVRVVDSCNLSTGQGLVVLEACRIAQTATDLDAMAAQLKEYATRVDASFLLDRLDYMVKGGRCSMVAALGANLLRLKPCIEVRNNKMGVAKKYRGSYAKCMENYVRERLTTATDLKKDLIFITHTPVEEGIVELVDRLVKECVDFDQIVETTAGCTISCHCGEGTLGILYVHENPI